MAKLADEGRKKGWTPEKKKKIKFQKIKIVNLKRKTKIIKKKKNKCC